LIASKKADRLASPTIAWTKTQVLSRPKILLFDEVGYDRRQLLPSISTSNGSAIISQYLFGGRIQQGDGAKGGKADRIVDIMKCVGVHSLF